MARPHLLPGDLPQVKTAGITTVVSLLEPGEAATVGLANEAEHCAALGLTFISHPIRDMQLPDPAAFAGFAATIASRLRAGDRIAIHCHASIGRSGMLACTVMGAFGHDAPSALAHVSLRRGTKVPDTAAQTAFIHSMIAAQHPQA